MKVTTLRFSTRDMSKDILYFHIHSLFSFIFYIQLSFLYLLSITFSYLLPF